MIRIFVTAQDIKDQVIKSDNDWFHYLTAVMRIKPGERLTVIVDQKKILEIEITGITKQGLNFITQETTGIDQVSKLKITLFQALPKQDKMSEIIKKCTELGVDVIYPLITARVENKSNVNKQSRWQQVLIQASMQSQRVTVPQLQSPLNISELNNQIAEIKEADLKLIFWEEETRSLKSVLKKYREAAAQTSQRIVVVIGPEGGLAADEVGDLISRGFKSVSLGKTVLRVENAAFAAMAAINYEFNH